MVVVLSGVLMGCRDAKKQAVVELQRRGLAPTAEALAEAVRTDNGDLLRYFADAEVRAGVPKEGVDSILQVAGGKRDWAMVERLLTFSGPEVVNHRGAGGKVILEQAVLADETVLAGRLLEAGARPELAASGADVLVRQAGKSADLMDRLCLALPPGHEALDAALLRAVAAGQGERVQMLLDRKADPDAVSQEGNGSALGLACAAGSRDLAARLIKAGAHAGRSPTALSHAVARKDIELVRLLLDAGADVRPAQGDAGAAGAAGEEPAPVAEALAGGQMEVVRLMLERGADPNLCLEHAFVTGDGALMDLLLERGLKLDLPGADGNPPLVRAAIEGKEGLIVKFLEKGASLEQTGALAQTAYHMAVIHRKEKAVEALLAAGAKPDSPFRKPAPEELLALFGSDYFVKWFKRDEGLTPLMLAASRGDVPQLRLLLKAGAKRGAQTKGWHRYPIVFACDTVNLGAAQILLGRNPDEETVRRHAVVSLSKQRVTLFQNDQPVRSARVSTGKKSTPTPPGKYVITDKQEDWVSSIYKVPMPFFMRLSCKEIGLHAGVVPGYPASHGCIRMPKGDVMAFFKTLKIGDPVTIEP